MKKWYIGAAAVVLVGMVACGGASKSDDKKVNSPGEEAPAVVQTTAAHPRLLKPEDVTVKLRITDKQCFGSAGCSVSWKIEAGVDPALLSDDTDYEVTYEVKGVEDGPTVSTFKLNGDGTYEVDEGFGDTPNKGTKLTVKVTGVDKIGL